MSRFLITRASSAQRPRWCTHVTRPFPIRQRRLNLGCDEGIRSPTPLQVQRTSSPSTGIMNHIQFPKMLNHAELPAASFCYRLEDLIRPERVAMVVDGENSSWIPPYYFTKAEFDSERAITLSSIAEIEQFARYLLSEDHPQRCSYVKELAINAFDGFPEACASMLVQVLEKCTQLEKLVLPNAEFLVTENRRFFDAICGLTSLKHLAMRCVGPHSFEIIKNIQSPIQSLVLDGDVFVESNDSRVDYNPSEDFKALRSTLTKLRMPWPYARKEDIDDTIRWIPPVPLEAYPLVSSLDVFGWNPSHVDVLMPMFPKLQHLRILHNKLPSDSDHVPKDLRAENIRLQAMSPVQWDSLESLEGIMTFVYALAISCPIRTLRLYPSFDCHGDEDAQRFFDTVSVAAPSNLMIAVYPSFLEEPKLVETLHTAKWNQLCISIEVKQYDTLEDIMSRLTACLQGVIAAHVEVSFIWGSNYDRPTDRREEQHEACQEEVDDECPPEDPILRQVFDAADLSTLGPKLSFVIPSATHICVAKVLQTQVSGYGDRHVVEDHSLKWRVDRDAQSEDSSSAKLVLSDKIMLQWTAPYKGWYMESPDDD